MMRNLYDCQKWLAIVWLSGASPCLLIIVVRALAHAWGTGADAVWQWFVPAIGPTLSLILGTLAASALNPDGAQQLSVRSFFFWLTMGLSTAYLAAVLGIVLTAAYLQSADPVKTAAVYLGFIQSLTSVAVGAMFSAAKK